MLKKTISYTDYDGNARKEDFFFNLSKAELTEMQLSSEGGLEKKINRIVQTQDNKEIIALFKDIICKSYGIKSDDGKRFIKTPEITEAFIQTEAYSELFMELATDDKAAAEFINGIVPAAVAEQINKQKSIPEVVPAK